MRAAIIGPERKPVFAAVTITAVILAAAWAVGVTARLAMDGWTSVEAVRVPRVGNGGYPALGRPPYQKVGIVGVDSSDNVLVEFYYFAGNLLRTGIVRYSISKHRWLPGVLLNTGVGPVTEIRSTNRYWLLHEGQPTTAAPKPGPDGTETWYGHQVASGRATIGFQSFGVEAVNGRFRELLGPGLRGWLYADAYAVDSTGTAWVAGWRSARFGSVRRPWCTPNERGLCNFPGRPVLARVTPNGAVRIVRVPVSGEVTAIAAGSADRIWLLDGYRVCPKQFGNGICPNPPLVSYEPTTGKFATFRVPTPFNLIGQPINAGADGRVWIGHVYIDGGGSALEFADGRFQRLKVRADFYDSEGRSLGLTALPILDRQGNVWICVPKGNPAYVAASSGQTVRIPIHPGALLSDPHGRLFSIAYGKQASVSC